MRHLSVIVAEDHPYSLEIISDFTKQFPGIKVIEHAKDGEELVYKTIIHKPDIAIVDINMPKKDGLTAIKECLQHSPNLKVIFVTAYSEYATDAFDINAIDYVVKPVTIDRLFRALENAKVSIYSQHSSHSKRLYVRQGANHHYIPKEELLFLEKVQHKVLIHTTNKTFETQETLESYMEKLDADFYRSHRSYIINLSMLNYIEPSGNTYLAYFDNYDSHAFIAKTQLNNIKQRMNIFKSY
ncbi:LytR/AlgR family response regulator transcription factor [Aquibacillus albus]|uniref:Two-component system LytT family response regulator n=1 Tax=Aquibacillus albus TaxID=1168171 RepID=A0ABS2MXU4_9BACI|nr:LytTR family DNA-binding domain-containing protein [Aquibacillus albus]MBM7570714.1 two-component system LytT family response regulator [Aquibacillus albus]